MSPLTTEYPFAAPLALRLAGVVVGVLGLVVVGLALLVGVLGWPRAVLTAGMLLALSVLAVSAVLAVRRPVVVRLDETGYRVRLVRGAGVRSARWREVEDVAATTVAGARCVVVRLRDGSSTTIPVGVLAGPPDAFVRDLRSRLDTSHGYRRLR